MTDLDLIVSRRKGEALLNFQNDVFESIKVVFHANTLNPLVNTLHFGIKPGHLFIYCKRRADAAGRWVLKDAGYINYFRADQTLIELTQFNTLDKQKLFTRGWLRVHKHEQAVVLRSFTLIPLHRRTVTFSFDDARASLVVDDVYFGNRWVYWNGEAFEKNRNRFRQQRRLAL
jgi:hypothetical protein